MLLLVRIICLTLLIVFAAQMTVLAQEQVIAQYGMRGEAVVQVQQYLIKAGFLQGKADGIFGKATLEAVKSFQKEAKLATDGVVRPHTLELLKKYRPPKQPADSPNAVPANKGIVRYGMRGDNVQMVQAYLVKAGFLEGRADGVFGYTTFQALKEFQRTVGIKVDGVAGPETLAALERYKPSQASRAARPGMQRQVQQPGGEIVDRPDTAKKWPALTMEATAYTRYDKGCTDRTYRGNYLHRGLVAVDPSVIPLGTKLYIPEYGYAVADDIGGAIQGYRIDLAMETRDEAFAFGRRNVTVYIVEA